MIDFVDPWKLDSNAQEIREELGIDNTTLLIALEPVQIKELARQIVKHMEKNDD